MVAGLNIRVHVWRMADDTDDDVGGAQITGSLQYTDLAARLTSHRPSQLLLQQGLETNKTFELVVTGNGLTIYERDEVEVAWPTEHQFYGDRFRVLGVQLSGRRQKYGPLQCTLSRIVRSRSAQ